MRRSGSIQTTLVVALAAALQACNSDATTFRHCVDEDGNVVDDDNCAPGSTRHRYWYGGYTPIGHHAQGGSYTAPRGGSAPHATVSRGGFGSTGAAHFSGGA
ncbi:MAG TPA: hypothetical protein VFS67_32310 [Polyangiaceae bacterium]|jgi:hypothetical protein|nr:hypothetical protein [Polyangiaceae bacterium]